MDAVDLDIENELVCGVLTNAVELSPDDVCGVLNTGKVVDVDAIELPKVPAVLVLPRVFNGNGLVLTDGSDDNAVVEDADDTFPNAVPKLVAVLENFPEHEVVFATLARSVDAFAGLPNPKVDEAATGDCIDKNESFPVSVRT